MGPAVLWETVSEDLLDPRALGATHDSGMPKENFAHPLLLGMVSESEGI